MQPNLLARSLVIFKLPVFRHRPLKGLSALAAYVCAAVGLVARRSEPVVQSKQVSNMGMMDLLKNASCLEALLESLWGHGNFSMTPKFTGNVCKPPAFGTK